MYTKEELAIRFVTKAFKGQKRLKEKINASFHSITVGFMLKDINAPHEIVLGGLLHDIIEDTKFGYDDIEKRFGKDIADIVLKVTEDQTIKNWKERKQQFINRFKNESEGILLIELADKLHNLLSDYYHWKKDGNDALKSIIATYEDNKWFYLEFKKIFNSKLKNNPLLQRYNEITKIYFEN